MQTWAVLSHMPLSQPDFKIPLLTLVMTVSRGFLLFSSYASTSLPSLIFLYNFLANQTNGFRLHRLPILVSNSVLPKSTTVQLCPVQPPLFLQELALLSTMSASSLYSSSHVKFSLVYLGSNLFSSHCLRLGPSCSLTWTLSKSPPN